MDCGRKLAAYLNKKRQAKYQGQRRSVFARYIGEVVNACKSMNPRIDVKELTDGLNAIANELTAKYDQQLDEHGKAITQEETTDYGENTVVVEG
jgi:DNA topoisomerase VI subunit B